MNGHHKQGTKCRHKSHSAANVSSFIGVFWHGPRAEWIGSLTFPDGSKRWLGTFGSDDDGELAAALAYNEAALEVFGPTAKLN